jgi:hypothetical protein
MHEEIPFFQPETIRKLFLLGPNYNHTSHSNEMKPTFTEDALSGQTAIEQIMNLNYQYIHGNEVDPGLKNDCKPHTYSVSRCPK